MKNVDDKRLQVKRTVLDAREMRRVLRRMAVELIERERDLDQLQLVGILTRGRPLAERLADEIEAIEGIRPPLGHLDITFYRDDLSAIGPQPVVKASHLPGPVEGQTVVLCDDVLFTGRTVRAALDVLNDYGRPRAVRLAVLVDRGHRELPIQPDYAGKMVPTARSEHVVVGFEDTDGEDFVRLSERLDADRGTFGAGASTTDEAPGDADT
ncbi:MAG: bifunctional pyr operon transcriptional regulator/uracil phosphoribosyltransferase PyrR [Acidobacteriota bacterium]